MFPCLDKLRMVGRLHASLPIVLFKQQAESRGSTVLPAKSDSDVMFRLHCYQGLIVCLFDLILYVHSTIFQLCGTVLPGFKQY